MLFTKFLGDSTVVVWFTFLFLTGVHVFANYWAVKSLHLKSINRERAFIICNYFLKHNKIPSTQYVAQKEVSGFCFFCLCVCLCVCVCVCCVFFFVCVCFVFQSQPITNKASKNTHTHTHGHGTHSQYFQISHFGKMTLVSC